MASVEELLIRLDATTEGLRRELKTAERSIGGFEQKTTKQLKKVDAGFSSLGATILKKYLPALSAAAASKGILDNIQAMEKVDVRLRRLTDGADDYVVTQKYLNEEAERLSINILKLSDGYAKLLTLQKSGIIDRSQVNALSSGLVDAAAALGATDAIDNVLYGLSQALSAGIVRAEDFNQVVEPLPGLLQELDKAAGLSSGGFRKLIVDGKVTSELFGTTLIEALGSYAGAAEAMSGTVSGSLTRLNNSWIMLSKSVGETGVAEGIAALTGSLASNINVANMAARGLMTFNEATGIVEKTTLVATKTIAIAWNGVQSVVLGAAEVTLSLLNGVFGAVTALRSIVPGGVKTGEIKGGLEETISKLRAARYAQAQDISNILNGDNAKAIENAEKRVAALNDAARTVPKNSKLSGEIDKETKAINKLIESLKFRNEQLTRTNKEQDLYNQLRAAGVSLDSQAGQKIKELVEEHDRLSEVQKKAQEKTESLKDAGRELGLTFTSAFEDAVIAGEDFGSVMQGLFQDISRIILRKGATEPLADLFGGITDDIIGSIDFDLGSLFGFSKGGVMSSNGPVPMKKYATGGIATGPQLALFGEGSHNEAYVPLPDGKSIPVTMRGESKGLVVNQSISIDARGADEGFIKRWPAIKAEIIRESKAAVASEASRGGAYAKSVGRR